MKRESLLNAWKKLTNNIFLPWLKLLTFFFLFTAIILSLIVKMPAYESLVNIQRWIAIQSVYLLFGGLPFIGLGFGFLSLLFLKTIKARVLILILMISVGWLTKGFIFSL